MIIYISSGFICITGVVSSMQLKVASIDMLIFEMTVLVWSCFLQSFPHMILLHAIPIMVGNLFSNIASDLMNICLMLKYPGSMRHPSAAPIVARCILGRKT
jgi:hypothetical protein